VVSAFSEFASREQERLLRADTLTGSPSNEATGITTCAPYQNGNEYFLLNFGLSAVMTPLDVAIVSGKKRNQRLPTCTLGANVSPKVVAVLSIAD
jgi:hypothetical protein